MTSTSKNSHLSYLDFLRTLCVLIVVVFHCLTFLTHGHFPIMKATYRQFNDYNLSGPIVVAMPLFTFISGYLYSYLRNIGKYPNDISFLKNKIKRLLLPYFFFVFLFCITTEFHQTDFIGILKHIWCNVIFGNYIHLWYLPVLFWCFIFIRLFEYISTTKVFILLLLVIASVLHIAEPISDSIFNIRKSAPWFLWFLLGFAFLKLKGYLMPLIANTKRKISACVCVCVCVCEIGLIFLFGFPEYKMQYKLSEITIISIAIIALFIIIEYLSKCENVEKFFTSKIVKSVSKYSFGIYIFHYWLAPLIISSTAKRIFHLEQFAEHYYIFPIVFSIVTFVASYAVTYLFQKTTLGKYLLG